MVSVRAIGNNLVASAITLVCGLGFAPVFFRILGAGEFGIFGIAQLLIGVYSLLELGSGAYVVRELAKALAVSDDGRQAKSVVQFGISSCVLSACAASLLLAFTATSILNAWSPDFYVALSGIVHLVAGLTFLTMIQTFLNSLLSGCQLQSVATWFSACNWVLRLTIGWFWLTWLPQTARVLLESQIFVLSLVLLVQTIFVFWCLRQKAAMPGPMRTFYRLTDVWKGYWKFLVHYFPATLLGFLVSNLDRIILMRSLGATEFGCFTIAKNLVNGMLALSQAITGYAYPVFASTFNDHLVLSRSFFRLQFALALLLLPPVITLLALPELLMALYSGDNVLGAQIAWYLVFLVAGFVMSMTGSLAQTLVVAAGQEKIYLYGICLSLVGVLFGWGVFEVTESLQDFFIISVTSAAISSAFLLYFTEKKTLPRLALTLLFPGWLLPCLIGLCMIFVGRTLIGTSWIGMLLSLVFGLIAVLVPNLWVYALHVRVEPKT
jgi:O-antigen/teichoic acid export membrane protein